MISEEVKFLAKHSSIYGLGTVISQVATFVLLPLYTRYLAASDYGLLELLNITSGIIGLVVTVGIATALSRFYYEFEDQKGRNKVVSTTYVVYAIVACFAFPVLFYISEPLATLLFKSRDYGHFFKVSFASLVIGAILDIGMMYLRVVKRSLFFVTVTITRLVLLITLNIVFIVYLQMGVLGILYSSLIISGIYALVITSLILRETKAYFSFKLACDMLKYSLPIVPSNLASTFVKFSDRYFLLHFVSMADVGIYSLAMKLAVAVHNLFTIPFNLAYIPRRFEIMKRYEAGEIYAKIFKYYVFLVTYIGLGLAVLVPEILQVMVTPEYYTAGIYVPLVVFSMIIFGCHQHFNFGILYSKQTKYLAYVNALAAVVNLGLNFFLILRFGLWGAVASYAIVVSFQAVALYFISNKLRPIEFEFPRILKYVLLAFMFYGVSRGINFGGLILDLTFKLSLLAVFPVLAILLKVVSHDETRKLKQVYSDRIRPLLIRTSTVKY